MGQWIETATSDSIADIGARLPRGRGQVRALDERSGQATVSPMPNLRGGTK